MDSVGLPCEAQPGARVTAPQPGAAVRLTGLHDAIRTGRPDREVFALLEQAVAAQIGFKVLTLLRIDPASLRSVRLHSSEPSYPVGGTKQHVRSAWSEAVLDRRTYYLAPGLLALRATFPDSAAIEAVGCGSIVAAPVVMEGRVLGTLNLWHEAGFYDAAKAEAALPFAAALAPVCARC